MTMLVSTRRALLGVSSEKFILRDDFSDTRAAGAVNGTPATPGPGTRTVVDTANNMSIGSGVAILAGKNSWGDPGYWLDPVVRTVGRFVIGKVAVPTTGNVLRWGWHNTTSGQPSTASSHVIFQSTATIQSRSGNIVTVGNFAATTYWLCIVLRASGHFLFIKGGEFTNWTLLWAETSNTTTPIYPFFQVYDNGVSLVVGSAS